MKYILIFLIWLGLLVIDGLFLPAFFNFPFGFGMMIFLSALIVAFGSHRWVILLGLFLSVMAELILGAHFGTIMGSWLIMALGWYFLNQFLNIKPLKKEDSIIAVIPFIFFGLILFVIGEGALWLLNHFLYIRDLDVSVLVGIISAPALLISAIIELFGVLMIFKLISSDQNG